MWIGRFYLLPIRVGLKVCNNFSIAIDFFCLFFCSSNRYNKLYIKGFSFVDMGINFDYYEFINSIFFDIKFIKRVHETRQKLDNTIKEMDERRTHIVALTDQIGVLNVVIF